ncbi:MAG: heme-binding domain-containing protein [Limisphaerales bacterium]|nr:MAG: heme-binding domain-containing protein [Limisphaerales bacterium]KAG0508578.1 MAG: heme-binding domain-containing protein [Limisphaerales bacterium]TXT50110.1 MAG: heme-binding domain-containing protein [Limisphaerales bacterium]
MNHLTCSLLVLLAGSVFANLLAALANDGLPSGLDKRIPLTTSRVVGSPEPPLMLRAKRAWPATSFNHPLFIGRDAGSERFLVVEQAGRILAIPRDQSQSTTNLFFELPNHDLYSFHFHPGFATNRFIFVFANGPNKLQTNSTGVVLGGTNRFNRILRYTVTAEGKANPASEHEIIKWWSNGHNGGEMVIGLDGMLYITSGDGTSDSDGNNTGQDISDLNSGLLRLDIEHPDPGKAFSIPKDNPFWNIPGARPELWAYGFRNPWRITMDPADGGLLVGDIGQDLYEMIELVTRGANFGWSVREGNHPFHAQRKLGPHPVTPPLIEHHHAEARSITGGVVYQGSRFPELRGAYVYGDYGTGKIWAAKRKGHQVTWHREIADTPHAMVGFSEGRAGEIFYVDYAAGQLFELEPTPPVAKKRPPFPKKLSESGLFAKVKGHVVQPALIPYSVNSLLWSDGTHKERFIALPGETQITFSEGAWKFPEETVLVKSFALDLEAGNPKSRKWIETRFMLFEQNEWVGYSYRWNDAQTDAELVEAKGADRDFRIKDARAPGGSRKQTWHYPSRAECMTCHSRAAQYVLGVTTPQMNREHDYAGVKANQLRTLAHIGAFNLKPDKAGVVKLPKPPEKMASLTNPYDETADLNLRARSYLHANCAHCHVEAGGGNSAITLNWNTTPEKMRLIGIAPLHDKFGLADALLVAPGAPERSILMQRVLRLGQGGMPPLAKSLVDEPAVKMLGEWIRGVKPPEAK